MKDFGEQLTREEHQEIHTEMTHRVDQLSNRVRKVEDLLKRMLEAIKKEEL
jgi:DNA-binding transcriptional regulator GbsR (MarR family)